MVRLSGNIKFYEEKNRAEKERRNKEKEVLAKKNDILEEMQRKLANLELREKLDNLEHEIRHKPCNCHQEHDPSVSCHCHPESRQSPARGCHCRPESPRLGYSGNKPPGGSISLLKGCGRSNNHCDCKANCKCQPENSQPEPTERDQPDHNCTCKGYCKCKPEHASHDYNSGETRGRPTSARPTNDDYQHSTPNGHRFSFHHRRYHNHSHQERTSTSPRDHSLASSLDIYSANDTRHASPHTAKIGDDGRDQRYREHGSAAAAGRSRRSSSRRQYEKSQQTASDQDIPRRSSSLWRSDREEDGRRDMFNKAQLDALRKERDDARALLEEARKRALQQEIDELSMKQRADEGTIYCDKDQITGRHNDLDTESAISLTSGEDGAPGSETEDEETSSPAPEPEIHQGHAHHVRLQSPIREVYDSGWRRIHDGRHSHHPAIIRVGIPRRHRSLSPSYVYERPRATSLGELGQRVHVHESKRHRYHGRGRARGSSLGARIVEYVTEGHLPSGMRERRYGRY